jgi:hypothetical protein
MLRSNEESTPNKKGFKDFLASRSTPPRNSGPTRRHTHIHKSQTTNVIDNLHTGSTIPCVTTDGCGKDEVNELKRALAALQVENRRQQSALNRAEKDMRRGTHISGSTTLGVEVVASSLPTAGALFDNKIVGWLTKSGLVKPEFIPKRRPSFTLQQLTGHIDGIRERERRERRKQRERNAKQQKSVEGIDSAVQTPSTTPKVTPTSTPERVKTEHIVVKETLPVSAAPVSTIQPEPLLISSSEADERSIPSVASKNKPSEDSTPHRADTVHSLSSKEIDEDGESTAADLALDVCVGNQSSFTRVNNATTSAEPNTQDLDDNLKEKHEKQEEGTDDEKDDEEEEEEESDGSESEASGDSAFGQAGVRLSRLIKREDMLVLQQQTLQKSESISKEGNCDDDSSFTGSCYDDSECSDYDSYSDESEGVDMTETFKEGMMIPRQPGTSDTSMVMSSDLYVSVLQEVLELRASLMMQGVGM